MNRFQNMSFNISISFVLLISSSIAFAQSLDSELEHYIKSSVIKNNFFQYADFVFSIRDSALYRSDRYEEYDDGYWFSGAPGFGFLPLNLLDIKVEAVALEYPDKSFKLYSVRIVDKSEFYFSPIKGVYLIGINANRQIKYISGRFLKHKIKSDFQFKKNKPQSYIPYLHISCFFADIKEITYTGKKEDDLFVYECTTNRPELEKIIITFNPEKPGKGYFRYIDNPNYKRPKQVVPVFTEREKKEYILNAVMKNIFTYRINTTLDMPQYKDEKYYLTTYDLPFDKYLPDYDEVFAIGARKIDDNTIGGSFEIYSIFKMDDRIEKSPYFVEWRKQEVWKPGDAIKEEENKYLPIYQNKIQPLEQFLVAYDTVDRRIYYISGNFYLNRVLNLYISKWRSNEITTGSGWPRKKKGNYFILRNYLIDRLHSYGITHRTDITVIKDDENELIAEATLRQMGKDVPVIIHVNYDYPEVVTVKERR